MTVKCKCGGKYYINDISWDSLTDMQFRRLLEDHNIILKHWQCDKCGATRQ